MRARVPYIDRIWRVKSSLDLDEPLSAGEAFERLRPLLQEQGTEVAVEGNTLSYVKTNPAAQDKLATFTAGYLAVVNVEADVDEGQGGKTRLIYDVTSTALFLCFLAPLAFLAFAQFAEVINELEKPGLLAEKEQREKEKAEEEEETKEPIKLHWIDEMLGATAPEQPDEDEEKSRDDARGSGEGDGDEEEEEEFEGNHSPTTAYVFAGIFFAIYLVGRVLEPFLLKRTFRAALAPAGRQSPSDETPTTTPTTNLGGSQASEMIANSG